MTELIWDTDDWNNAVSESETIVDGALHVSIAEDGFESYTLGSFPPAPWNQVDGGQVDDTEANTGSQSLQWQNNTVSGTAAYSEGFHAYPYDQIVFRYNETTDSNTFFMRVLDDSDNEIMFFGSNNPQADYSVDGNNVTLVEGPSPNYGEWRQWTATFDWANNEYDAEWVDIGGSTDTASASNADFTNNASEIGRIEMWEDGGGSDFDCWIDDISAITASDANLITAGKTS